MTPLERLLGGYKSSEETNSCSMDFQSKLGSNASELPAITTAQMREVDRLMVASYGIELIQMMENAGRHLAELARYLFLAGNPVGKKVFILAGSGGNGGGGLVAARRLHNWGANVQVVLTRATRELQGVPAQQLAILKKVNLPIMEGRHLKELSQANLIVDALIGYSLSGARAAWLNG